MYVQSNVVVMRLESHTYVKTVFVKLVGAFREVPPGPSPSMLELTFFLLKSRTTLVFFLVFRII